MKTNSLGYPMLQRKYFTPKKVQFARMLRHRRTMAEAILWDRLSGKQLGVKFRQQAIVLGWIADFYCPSVALVIEVDGSSHTEERFGDDIYREVTMEEHGYRVIRFTNEQVLNDTEVVVETIKRQVENMTWIAGGEIPAIRRASERNRKNFDCLKEGE